jgi:hypothetical protein
MQWLPLLQLQRDLLNAHPGTERFQQYLDTMLDAHRNLRLPLSAFNPMSKGHVADLLDELLAMHVECIGQTAMEEAGEKLANLAGSSPVKVGLVVADDAKGGWTNRWLFEAKHQFESSYEQKRGIATVLLWSSEPSDMLRIRQKVMVAIHRHVWIENHGPAKTLGDMVRQEGMAGHFSDL